METFQTVFVFSPPTRAGASQKKEESPKKLECLFLKPFSSTPCIDFDNVQIGSSSTQKFEIANPSNKDLTVIFVTPADFSDRGFILNESSIVVPKNSTIISEIQWKPTKVLSCSDQIHVKIAENPRYCGKININAKSSAPKKKLGKRTAPVYVVPKVQTSSVPRRETYEVPSVDAKFKWPSPKSDALITPDKTFTKCENSLLDMNLSLGESVLNKTENVASIPVKEPDFHQALLDISYGTISSTKKIATIDEECVDLELSLISNNETPMKKRCLMSIENTPSTHSSTPLVSKISIQDKENFLVPKPIVRKINFSHLADTTNFSAKCPSFDDFQFNYGVTTISNPFTKNAVYPLKWVEQYSTELLKWLNSILMPHKELTDMATNVDLPSLWKKAIASDKLLLAQTKEVASSKYHQNEEHLLLLRKGAKKFFKSEKIIQVLKVVRTKVERGFFEIKDELDLSVDQGVRYKMVQLIMCYNPLWLRIALETIFDQQIVASSKNIAGALVLFLKNNFLTNKSIVAKNMYTNTKCRMPTFRKEMNDYITFKFLSLIFFLDQAKMNHLIPYDPCLFNKSSPIKESEAIFTEFIKEFVKCVSHMKRTMSNIGFTLLYKQTPFHEFDFAVKTHLDLRDGVSLAKSMEIILKDKNVCNTLLMPAISRLQKLHNVKIILDALLAQGFVIDDVTVYDIVNGHREKTMSLLWQILHKFLGPRYEAAAQKIQKWWRETSLFRFVKLRIIKKRKEKLEKMATLIQSAWRGFLVRKHLKTIIENLKQEKKKRDAIIKIQQKYRAKILMRKAQLDYQTKKNAAIRIQQWFRSNYLFKTERQQYLKLRLYSVHLQRRFRANVLMRKQHEVYCLQRASAVRIQQWYRSTKMMREQTVQFQKLRTSALIVQKRYRAIKAMRINQAEYQKMKKAAIYIQQWYRATVSMKVLTMEYQKLRTYVIIVQQQYRALKAMRTQQAEYQKIRNAAIYIQQWYRACSLMKIDSARYQELKSSTIAVQRRYRANILMRRQLADYTLKRNSSIRIQQWYRATRLMEEQSAQYRQLRTNTINIQQRYRAIKAMRKQQAEYQKKRKAAIFIQQWYRATKLMREETTAYQKLRISVITTQQQYRAIKAMRKQQAEYQKIRNAAIRIQEWYRATRLMKVLSMDYQKLRNSVVTVQQQYRALMAMRAQRAEYQKIRNAAICIQQWYRACSLMKIESVRYQELKSSAIAIQRRFRANILMQRQLADYTLKRSSALRIQQWYRATKLMKEQYANYSQLRASTVIIQQRYRAIKDMRIHQAEYQKIRNATISIQQWYRATKLMREETMAYQKLRISVITVQQQYRAIKAMRTQRAEYQKIRNAAIHIQEWYRACLSMKIESACYQEMKSSAIVIQRRFRAHILMQRQLADYTLKRSSALRIQQWYRATKLMKEQYANYIQLRASTVIIQQRYRAIKAMRKQQAEYQNMREAAVIIQRRFRANILMQRQLADYMLKRSSVLRIQHWYRATKLMKKQYANYSQLRAATIIIQQQYRAITAMRKQQAEYQKIRNAAIRVQEWYRATMLMKAQSTEYQKLRIGVITVQQQYRAIKAMRMQRAQYQEIRDAAIRIQQWYRAYSLMKIESVRYQELKSSAIVIQRRFRANILMQKQLADYTLKRNSALRIQQWYRATKLMIEQYANYSQLRAATIIIQQRYRAIAAMRTQQTEYQNMRKAAVLIQKLYRTTKTMRAQAVAFQTLRNSVIAVQQQNRQKNITLAAKFPKIIATLRQSNQISVVVEETSKLDRVVRHSPKLGLELIKLPDLNKILFYHLAVECRSEPYKIIFNNILGILVNISLNKNAVNYLWEIISSENGLMIIVSVMNKFYKSNSEIFCKAVTLLWILCQSNERSMIISKNVELCRRLKYLIGKVPKTNQAQKLPDLRPNFGYGRNWSNEFQNPHFALFQLLKSLKI